MALQAPSFGIRLPDRELACAPIHSELGQSYLGAMRAAMNCALANRQILTHLCRESFRRMLARAELRVLYDVSHNICKVEEHVVQGQLRSLHVHRKDYRQFAKLDRELANRFFVRCIEEGLYFHTDFTVSAQHSERILDEALSTIARILKSW